MPLRSDPSHLLCWYRQWTREEQWKRGFKDTGSEYWCGSSWTDSGSSDTPVSTTSSTLPTSFLTSHPHPFPSTPMSTYTPNYFCIHALTRIHSQKYWHITIQAGSVDICYGYLRMGRLLDWNVERMLAQRKMRGEVLRNIRVVDSKVDPNANLPSIKREWKCDIEPWHQTSWI